MAVFKCTHCGHETERDLRTKQYKDKTKYKSYCGVMQRFIFMMLKK